VFKADSQTIMIQLARIAIRIKSGKGTDNQVSDLLNLIEETNVFHLSLLVTC
jgi:hypothetical protein